ncbi:MAG: NAD(P)H-binding protein, partial [Parvularcula sp.]|nr:NAD(P)H-binding protein [Parvularcula sp.]
CVQKPKLAFQRAKIAFEEELKSSGLTYTIVRPTAFFKSLSGQIERLKRGKPFLVFGDGKLTACKPISDRDLARFLVGCIDDSSRHNVVLPIGGPGPAITPHDQGLELFRLLGSPPRFQKVPPALFTGMARVMDGLALIVPNLKEKAELARIARYYGTESMLVWDPEERRYDSDATPSFGSDTLFDHYRDLIEGTESEPSPKASSR